MSKDNLDTTKMNEAYTLLMKEIGNFENIVNSMFERIEKMPDETKEWRGESAKKLVAISKKEKENDFDKVVSILKKLANEFKQASSDFETVKRDTKANDKNLVG